MSKKVDKFSKISFLGAGIWATALAKVAAENGTECLLWTLDEEQRDEINAQSTNEKFAKDIKLSRNITATTSLVDVLKFSSTIIIAVPTKVIKEVIEKLSVAIESMNYKLDKKLTFIIISKGFSPTGTLISHYIKEVSPKNITANLVSLVGPSLAQEVLEEKLTCISAASELPKLAVMTANTFTNNKYFHVTVEKDIDACLMLSALKNIYAIFSGTLWGLNYEYNTNAIFITFSLKEMKKILKHFGLMTKLSHGLVGLGDMLVTATNKKSRNFSSGYELGKLNDSTSIHEWAMHNTVEGYTACKIIVEKIGIKNLKKFPILEAIYEVLYNNRNPHEIMHSLFKNPNFFIL